MRRKKTGYILLALLVITGLAGRISGSITSKERRVALNLMKSTKSDVLQSLKGLTSMQLNYKTTSEKWSARECMYHIAISENNLWQLLQTALKSPSNPEMRSEIKVTDLQIIQLTESKNYMVANELPEARRSTYKSLTAAMDDFKKKRTEHIEYIKSTTEDLRDHIVQTPFGWMDCYQLCLMIASHSNRHLQQINETKQDAAYSMIK